MAVSYPQIVSSDMLWAEIEKLVTWQHDVMRQAFYQTADGVSATPPATLLQWAAQDDVKKNIPQKPLEQLQMVHAELGRLAARLLAEGAKGISTADGYDAFRHQCAAYIAEMRYLQQVVEGGSQAIDALTGLRTQSGMAFDIKREQDRYDRGGKAFAVTAVEIDNLAALSDSHDRPVVEVAIAHVARLLTRTVRSFDDAYYLGNGEFVLALKQVDFMDACAVMDRLRRDIESSPLELTDGRRVELTASFGVAEAQLRESADLSLEHARSALLDAQAAGGNTVSEYREMSALEQYARDIKKK